MSEDSVARRDAEAAMRAWSHAREKRLAEAVLALLDENERLRKDHEGLSTLLDKWQIDYAQLRDFNEATRAAWAALAENRRAALSKETG